MGRSFAFRAATFVVVMLMMGLVAGPSAVYSDEEEVLGPPGGGVGGPGTKTSHCVVYTAGDPARAGTCVGAAGCISRTGFLGPVWNPTPYLSCDNFNELPYDGCKLLIVPDGECWPGWGWETVCLTFDCYSSVGPLGTPACVAGAMVGSDSVSIDQCW